jgi:6,7-dimethyl-8-ribityllumazine synthase
MGKIYQGSLIVEGKKFAIVVSRFNEFISQKLLDGAVDCLVRHGTAENNIDIFWTPGSFEIPQIAKKIIDNRNYDAIVCIGVIIRGATPHFEYIASEVTKGIGKLSLNGSVAISFGILTVDTIEQATERAGTKSGNKGWQAALSAIELVNLGKEIKKSVERRA